MKIITLTLSPAFDVHCHIPCFQVAHENLATVISRDVGGKGINISRALSAAEVENLALVVLGKENAPDFRNALAKEGMMWREIEVEGRIRENITIHTDNASETRVSFSGFSVDETLLSRVEEVLEHEKLDQSILTFTGRVPEGLSMESVKRFLQTLSERGARLVIDSKTFTLLDLVECHPYLIKPNEEEIAEYLGKKTDTLEDALLSAEKLHCLGMENVMITLGKKGAVLFCREGAFVANAPEIAVRSTIGAGDSAIAGFLSALRSGKSKQECLCTAVAFGSAACLTVGTQAPKKEGIEQMRGAIVIRRADRGTS